MNIVLIAPEIPHNTGAVGRLCVCLGARLHLIRPLGFALTASHLKRAGLDYWAHLDLTVHTTWEAFLAAENPGQLIFGSTRATQSYLDCRVSPNCTLVFGNESSGLPPEFYTRYRDDLYALPMPGRHARSHNLAMAVAVFAYEAYRQHHAVGLHNRGDAASTVFKRPGEWYAC